ncbi:hypothetical protein HFN98_24285 [Rhizobium laguerreae]|uniref:hypothetical protein n=1 Tax=Rhizobium laguerreae TaxID=1076926 RepID=UPI001C90EAEF|nr:hypothetical protein [Rhizobium laguerreae]MBY3333715.1 hypothetical protein [Rhizobium laguerreae]
MGEIDLDELDELLREYVFSINFDGDAGREKGAIHEWVKSAILAERQRCAAVVRRLPGNTGVYIDRSEAQHAILNP